MKKKKQGATLEELAKPRKLSDYDFMNKQCKGVKAKGQPANKKRYYPQPHDGAKYFESLLEEALEIYLD